jgi:hypothetical protein
MPAATQKNLGSNKWSAGPAFVVLTIQGPWVIGALANNQWSFASAGSGKAVNQMLIQPFINYNFPDGHGCMYRPVRSSPPTGIRRAKNGWCRLFIQGWQAAHQCSAWILRQRHNSEIRRTVAVTLSSTVPVLTLCPLSEVISLTSN